MVVKESKTEKKRTPKTFSLCQFDGCNPWLACSALLNITLREAIFSSHECMIAKTIIVLKLPLRDSSVEVSNRKSAVEGDRIKYSLILASNVKKPGQDTR